jgi:hypothetical protein
MNDNATQTKNEWENEPNFLEFIDDSTGYKCFIIRNADFGFLCGYVQIPREHKLYNESWHKIAKSKEIIVHGGVTYANNDIIQLTKKINESKKYYIGFDCGHETDIKPYYTETQNALLDLLIKEFNYTKKPKYRNIEYVTNECKKLAKQLKMYE